MPPLDQRPTVFGTQGPEPLRLYRRNCFRRRAARPACRTLTRPAATQARSPRPPTLNPRNQSPGDLRLPPADRTWCLSGEEEGEGDPRSWSPIGRRRMWTHDDDHPGQPGPNHSHVAWDIIVSLWAPAIARSPWATRPRTVCTGTFVPAVARTLLGP